MEINDNERLWKTLDGDHRFALDWPVGPDSVVWEIGGFEGRWASQMVETYDPYISIFEPQQWAVQILRKKFKGNPKVKIFPHGLWTHDSALPLWEHDTDGASVVKQAGRTREICDFADIFQAGGGTVVDVCLMNIEGGEFVLLPYLIGLDQMRLFRFFWCQFHPGVMRLAKEKTKLIYRGLEKTHHVLWDYYPTAVAWERK